ncbi:hypothetical protein [Desulfovibrio falkowii]|uniref:hypothetical protein n=1 Tax=Desulfovibrio sp. WGS1351 TaxID=3366814 RepID=UPI00372D1345
MNKQSPEVKRLQADLEEKQNLILELYLKLEQRSDRVIALQKELRSLYSQADAAHMEVVCDAIQ